jgi:zinc transporter 2
VSLLTLTFATRRAGIEHSFGYHRAEVVGALFSVASLWLVTGMLLAAAVQRLARPEDVSGPAMFGIALAGVAVNLALVAVLRGAQGHGHSHGGLSGAEDACGGGHGGGGGGGGGWFGSQHGHSHSGEGPCIGSVEEGGAGGGRGGGGGAADAPGQGRLLQRTSSAGGGLANGGGGSGHHGHSHVGGTCGANVPRTSMRLGAPPANGSTGAADGGAAASDSVGAPAFPEGALFFTRGRALSPPPAPAPPLAADDASSSSNMATIPPALAAAAAAAAAAGAPPSPARSRRGSASSSAAPSAASAPHDGGGGGCDGHGHDDDGGGNVNMRGAYLHVLADLLQSCGVALAGALIWWRPSLRWVDPACTFAFSAAVLATTARLLRDVVDIIMERTPRAIDAAAVSHALARLPGVAGVHDLHIWALMPGKPLLSVHLRATRGAAHAEVLAAATAHVQRQLRIAHCTIQVEDADADTDALAA